MGWLLRSALFAILSIVSPPALADPEEKPLEISASIPRSGDFLAFGFGSVWMMSGSRLARIDPVDNSVVDTIIDGTSGKFRAYQLSEGAVFLPDVLKDVVFQFDPETSAVVRVIPVDMDQGEGSIGVGEGSVWVMEDGVDRTHLVRLSARDGARQATITLPADGAGVRVAFGSVWVTAPRANELYRIDPSTSSITQVIPLKPEPRFLTSDVRSIWVADQSGFIQKINGTSGVVEATIATGREEGGGDIDAGGGFVWLSFNSLPLMQVDAKSNSIVAIFQRKYMGDAVRYGAGSLWISGDDLSRVIAPR